MNIKELLLILVMEECDEVSQRASKAIRFTLEEVEPNGTETRTNGERIIHEFNDLYAVMELLHASGHIDRIIDRDLISLKKEKILKWIEYSEQKGTLKPEA